MKYRIKVESISGEYWCDDLYTLKDDVYWDSDGDYGIPSECVISRELIKEDNGDENANPTTNHKPS